MQSNTNPVIHAEVVNGMTSYEKTQLMNELAALLQNMDARINVSQERGFPYLWRVLNGNQHKIQNEILVGQNDVNKIVQQLLTMLWDKQADQENDIAVLQVKMNQLSVIVHLQQLLLNRIAAHFPDINAKTVLQDIEDIESEMGSISTKLQTVNPTVSSAVSPMQPDSRPVYKDIKTQIREQAQMKLNSSYDFESFLQSSQFGLDCWELGVADGGIFWETVYQCYGWKIQQWKMDLNHYRILDPNKTRRAWTLDPQELLDNLEKFRASQSMIYKMV